MGIQDRLLPLLNISTGGAGYATGRELHAGFYGSFAGGVGIQMTGPLKTRTPDRVLDTDAGFLLLQGGVTDRDNDGFEYATARVGFGNWVLNGYLVAGMGSDRDDGQARDFGVIGLEGNVGVFQILGSMVNLKVPEYVPTLQGAFVIADGEPDGQVGLTFNLFNLQTAL